MVLVREPSRTPFLFGRKANLGTDPDNPKDMPSEFVLRRVFESFGDVRCVDIPSTDRYRSQMSKTGVNSLQPASSMVFVMQV